LHIREQRLLLLDSVYSPLSTRGTALYLGQIVGWYKAGESAGFIGGIVGAIILLFVYGLIAGRQGRAA